MVRRQLFDPGRQGNIQRAMAGGASDDELRRIADAARAPQTPAGYDQTMAQAAELAHQNIRHRDAMAMQQQELGLRQQQILGDQQLRRAQGNLDHQRAAANHRLQQRSLAMQERQGNARIALAAEAEGKRMSDSDRMQAQWEMASADVMSNDIRDLLKAARGIEYTPEGRMVYSQLAAVGRDLMSQKGRMRPAQYLEMAGQFMRAFEEADLGSFQVQPKGVKEVLAERFQDMGNGMGAFLQPDGSLKVLQIDADEFLKAGSEDATKIATPQEMAMKLWGGPKNVGAYNKAYTEAQTRLQEQWMRSHPDAVDPPSFDPDEIEAEMMGMLERQHRFQLRQMGVDTVTAPGEAKLSGADALKQHFGGGQAMDAETAKRVFQPVQDGSPQPRPDDVQRQQPASSQPVPFSQQPSQDPTFFQDMKGETGKMFRRLGWSASQPAVQGGADDRSRAGSPAMEPAGATPEPIPPREPLSPQAAADEEYFASNPAASRIREMFDSGVADSNEGMSVLAKAVQSAGLEGHPAKYVHPIAVKALVDRGAKDPIGDASRAVAAAIENKTEHFSLMGRWQQEALANSVQVLDPNNPDDRKKIEALPPGSAYMDPALNIYEIEGKNDKSILRRAAEWIGERLPGVGYKSEADREEQQRAAREIQRQSNRFPRMGP